MKNLANFLKNKQITFSELPRNIQEDLYSKHLNYLFETKSITLNDIPQNIKDMFTIYLWAESVYKKYIKVDDVDEKFRGEI